MPDTLERTEEPTDTGGLDAETFAQLLETVARFVRERLVPLEAKVAELEQRLAA